MKYLIITFLIGISIRVNGQNLNDNIQDKDVFYSAKKGITFYVLDLTKSNPTTTEKQTVATKAQKSNPITIVEEKQTAFPLEFIIPNTLTIQGEYTEVQFLDIEDEMEKTVFSLDGKSSTKLKSNNDYINSSDNGKRFFIKTTELSKFLEDGNIEQQFKRWTPKLITGATIATPFKFRPKIRDKNYIFTPELSLGPFIGANFRMDKRLPIFFNAIASAGINSINIQDNVQIEKDGKDGLALGFYGSIGAVIQVNDFQIGALYGYDFVSGEMGKNWLYNEKPWFSFSIGFNFLSSVNKAEAKAKKQTKEINEQILWKDFFNDKNVVGVKASINDDGTISYEKIYADARRTLDTIPKETSVASDNAIGKGSENLTAAKVIQKYENNPKAGKWVYFGELKDEKYIGEFGESSLPKIGAKFSAMSPVYKRDSYPKLLANGKWQKGNIIGAVEKNEEIQILETMETSNGQYIWVRIE